MNGMTDEEKLTFNELRRQGFIVKKGQRHVALARTGEALFTRSQCDEDPYHNDPNTGGKIWHLIRPQKMN